jgi:PHS family inorganic phosphate transporter-like MFS transporter
MAILYAIWAGILHAGVSTAGLLTIFTISQLVLNSSVNVTTFLLPVEVFPTRVRGTAHGIAAAAGKCGAVLTAFTFGSVNQKIGLPGVLGLFSGIMALCAVCTLWIPETKGVTIDEVENDVLYGGNPDRLNGSSTESERSISVTLKQDSVAKKDLV